MDKDNNVAVSVYPATQGNWDVHSERVETGTQVDLDEVKQSKYSLKQKFATFCSEFGATFVIVFLGCMGCVVGMSGGDIPHETVCWTFGLAVLVSVQCFGHLSGSHLNPIVTTTSVILGYTPLAKSIIYFVGQFAGAISAYGLLILLTPPKFIYVEDTYTAFDGTVQKKPGACSPGVNPNISVVQALFVEYIASAILVLVCCGVWDRRNADKHDSTAIRFGLSVGALALAAGPYTGANMNPARSFAPALFNGDWVYHWVYWVGPLSASLTMGYFYKWLFQLPAIKKETPESEPLH